MPSPLTIAVFGSSQPLPGSDLYEDARSVGAALARVGWTVVTGGYHGVMEGVSRGAKEAGGRAVGITSDYHHARGLIPNGWLDEERRVATYADRLYTLARTGDGYVVMNGGTGTLTELFFVWELVRNGSLPPRPIVLYGERWRRVMDALANEIGELTGERHFCHIAYANTPEDTVRIIAGSIDRSVKESG